MALLPESVTAATTGHPGYHNQIHQKLNQAHLSLTRDYGAVGDGSTDDTTAVQAALTAAAASRVPVFIPPNKTFLVGALTITAPIRLFGAGWSSILKLKNATNAYLITFSPAGSTWFNGATFENFKLECNGAAQTTGGGGIDGMGAVWCRFRHLWVNRPWGNGIYLHQDNLGGYGHHNTINACLFDEGEQTNGGDGRAIRLDLSDENTVSECTFQDNGRAAATEPNHIYDLAGLNRVVSNDFVGGQTGLKIQGHNSIAALNVFDGCKNHHIRVNGNNNKINDNRFYNIGFTGTNIDGIWVDNVTNAQINSNFFDTIATVGAAGGTARSAVNLSSGPSTNAVFQDNTILANGQAYGSGAVVRGSGTGHIIRNNRGWTTESNGTATVTSAATSATVTHGLSVTPALQNITVVPTNNGGTSTAWWISGITSTQFVINATPAPGATTATFAWQIQAL